MNKIIIIIIILLIAALGFIFWKNEIKKDLVKTPTPAQILENSIKADTVDEIDVSLEDININSDVDEDLKNIDAELQNI
jgi:3-isopropylmalate dehydratase small subunit